MITIEEMEQMLDEIAEELPQEFYKELNGGIILLPETKRNTELKSDDLYILGQYHRNGSMGRYISIYYGSIMAICGNQSNERIKNQLKKTLKHEFTHHLESLGGERGLEIEDEKEMAKYAQRKARQSK